MIVQWCSLIWEFCMVAFVGGFMQYFVCVFCSRIKVLGWFGT